MIDNFDDLVARCNRRRRRKMIRRSLIITAAILSVIAAAAAIEQWVLHDQSGTSVADISSPTAESNRSTQIPVAATKPSEPPAPTDVPKVQPEPLSHAVQTAPSPDKLASKERLYVLQLLSSVDYDKTAAALKKVPEIYRSGTFIYKVNNQYTLRYIDIFDPEAIPSLKQAFKEAGFHTPITYQYNPKRKPLAQDQTPSNAELQKIPMETDISKPPHTSSEPAPLFKVDTPSKPVSSNLVDAYAANPKYDTALAAARSFYAKGNYADAAVWAKKANQLNREGEDAWLLYAKSYFAQGRKNEAIGVLELYLNYKDSKSAGELLHTWKTTGGQK